MSVKLVVSLLGIHEESDTHKGDAAHMWISTPIGLLPHTRVPGTFKPTSQGLPCRLVLGCADTPTELLSEFKVATEYEYKCSKVIVGTH